MITAKLVDNIWATRKSEKLNGYKLMIAEVNNGKIPGEKIVVVDIIGAGIGDSVIVTTGSAARRMLDDDTVPVDAAVVGIIDAGCEDE
jgi:ethanolamine utilization protein EutN